MKVSLYLSGLRNKQGNTLIEMLTVIVILGILLALAAPYVIGDLRRSQDTQTKRNLALAFDQLKKQAISTSSADCAPYDPPCVPSTNAAAQQLQTTFPLVGFTPGLPNQGSAVVGQIGVETDSQNEAVLCVKSQSGNFFSIRYVTSGTNSGTYYGAGDSCTDGSKPATPGIPYDTSSGPNPTPAAQGTNETTGDEWTAGGGSGSSGGGGNPGGTTISNPVNVTKPAISGNPGSAPGALLSVSTGTWNPDFPPTGFTYQWKRGGAAISGAQANTYTTTAPDMNSTLTVDVVATTAAGGSTTVTTNGFLVANPPSGANGANAPAISGSAQDLQTLTASTGIWSGTPPFTYSYQWQEGPSGTGPWSDISGATSSTYNVNNSDIGKYIHVVVTATNSSSSASSTSASTSSVAPAPPVNTGGANAPGFTSNGPATPYQGDTFTATPGTWSATGPLTYTYQWQRCNSSGAACVNIPGETTSTYVTTNSDIGNTVRVVVTATGPGGSSSSPSPVSNVIVSRPPANSGGANAPTVTGGSTPQAGTPLTAANGTWSGTLPITYTYQWLRCDENGSNCVSIPAATAQNYTPVTADIGQTLKVTVTGTNGGGTSSITSAQTSLVVQQLPANTGGANLPAISNLDSNSPPQDQDRLSVTNGSWNGTTPLFYTYSWLRCDAAGNNCVTIPGAQSTSYQLLTNGGCESGTGSWNPIASTLVQVATPVSTGSASCQVTASGAGTFGVDQAGTVSGATAGRIWDEKIAVYATGTTVGKTFQLRLAEEGGASGAASTTATVVMKAGWNYLTVSRTFTANDRTAAHMYVEILGGTAADKIFIDRATIYEHESVYTLVPADIGSTIRNTVQATNPTGSASATSPQTAVIAYKPPVSLIAPVSADNNGGSLMVGDTVSSTQGSWNGSPPMSYTYQWQNSPDGSSWSNIGGATASTYAPVISDIDKYVRSCVTADNPAPGNLTSCSNSVGLVRDVPKNAGGASAPSTGSPAIWGQVRTATDGTWTGTATITYTYQWQRCDAAGNSCSNLGGQTSNSYTPVDADVGNTLRIVVTGTNGYGSNSATSPATAVSADTPVNTGAPSITGTPQAGQTLSVSSNGTWNPRGAAPSGYVYQWQANGSNIGGATGSSYIVSTSYTSQTITVLVRATNSGGTSAGPGTASNGIGPITGYTPSNGTCGASYSNGSSGASICGYTSDTGAASGNMQINWGINACCGSTAWSSGIGTSQGATWPGIGGLGYNQTVYWQTCTQNAWASSCSGASSFVTTGPPDCDGDYDGSSCYTNASISSSPDYDQWENNTIGFGCSNDGDDYSPGTVPADCGSGFRPEYVDTSSSVCNPNNISVGLQCLSWGSDSGDSDGDTPTTVMYCNISGYGDVAPSSGWQEWGGGGHTLVCYGYNGSTGSAFAGDAAHSP